MAKGLHCIVIGIDVDLNCIPEKYKLLEVVRSVFVQKDLAFLADRARCKQVPLILGR